MAYGEISDHSLDKSVAWCITCLLVALLAVISVWSQKEYQGYILDREALKSGYCQVLNPQQIQGMYHWEKCQAPTTPAK
jgi:hypothetical protein